MFDIPSPGEREQLLLALGLAPADREEMLRFPPHRGTELWRLLAQAYEQLIDAMGRTGRLPDWPDLPAKDGAAARYGYAWVFLAATKAVRDYHIGRGIPDDVSWQSLAVIGNQMRYRRAIFGQGGLHAYNWTTHHFRGVVYALGRLHFERRPIWFDAGGHDPCPRPDDDALGVHIPEGRLAPSACDESIRLAGDFFRRHYPEHHYRYATCVSWVLDPQLSEYLPYDANILAFQRRFHILPLQNDRQDDNRTVVEFVFQQPLDELDQLPQRTTLQRAIVHHIRAGRRWQFRTGWFAL